MDYKGISKEDDEETTQRLINYRGEQKSRKKRQMNRSNMYHCNPRKSIGEFEKSDMFMQKKSEKEPFIIRGHYYIRM